MKIDEKDFILIVESLRAVRESITEDKPLRVIASFEEVNSLINRLVEEYQAMQDGEPTTADEFNNADAESLS